jgi:hypothetical protein
MARRTGAVVELIRNDAYGQVSVEALRAQQLNVSVSILTSTRLDMAARGLSTVVRASAHYYNTDEEIERLCAALSDV